MTDRNSRLDERQERAIARLACGAKASSVAAEVGVSPRQMHRWRTQNAEFMAALSAAQQDAYREGTERMGGMLDVALDALHDVLTDPNSPPVARIKAAEVVIARTLDAKRNAEPGVSADDARMAFREFARQNPDEARALLADAE